MELDFCNIYLKQTKLNPISYLKATVFFLCIQTTVAHYTISQKTMFAQILVCLGSFTKQNANY